jgi:hypothetical protein
MLSYPLVMAQGLLPWGKKTSWRSEPEEDRSNAWTEAEVELSTASSSFPRYMRWFGTMPVT